MPSRVPQRPSAGAGRWTSRLPPPTFDRHRSGSSRCSRDDRPRSPKRSGSTLVVLAPPSERSRLRRNVAGQDESRPRSASRGLARFSPFAVLPAASTPGDAGRLRGPSTFGPGRPVPGSCSARVDSHHLDGLLRIGAGGFVAPRLRPWGSSRCRPRIPRSAAPGPKAEPDEPVGTTWSFP